MDVREKLVELLDIIIQPGQKTLGDIADHLVAHNVTVQEWISVEDRLPEKGEGYAVVVSGKPCRNVTLDNAIELAAYDQDEGWILEMWPEWTNANITYWMPMPKLPEKEGENT